MKSIKMIVSITIAILFSFMEANHVKAECINIDNSLFLNMSCTEYSTHKYAFGLDFYPNPHDPDGIFWKMDISSFKEISSDNESCIYVNNDLKLQLLCAEYIGNKYAFDLDFYLNPHDLFGIYWKMDISSFRNTYTVEEVNNNSIKEYRFILNNHHFMTLVDDNGTLNFRPHPGVDVNGWGSSWYIQPFFPGAVLSHAIIDNIKTGGDGIQVNASGSVSYGSSSDYGTWSTKIFFEYNQKEKTINGKGEYLITLDGQLSESTGDLNLYKIATNYLDDVPLMNGETGDTGDMKQVNVIGDNINFTWIPPVQPSHFPNDITDILSVDVIGQYNNIDTAKQGLEQIEPAYKPSLKVILTSHEAGINMIYGSVYDVSKSKLFNEDNVGITPLILKQSSKTEFLFDIKFESKALPGDGE